MRLISQGAEAKIYLTGCKIIKDRVKKEYRIKEIDDKLRKFRTKREEKILDKLHKFGFVPNVLESDEKEKLAIEYIEGPKLRDILDEKDQVSREELCREIGKKVKLMHENHIIHGDLTTSNMILSRKDSKVYFIDFGLSFVSHKDEDKAVDLHLLKQALESRHYRVWEECFGVILKEYGHKAIIERLGKVEARGRYKGKGSLIKKSITRTKNHGKIAQMRHKNPNEA